jgi:hypothetical protein
MRPVLYITWVAKANITWVAKAHITWVAKANITWVAKANITWVAKANYRRPGCMLGWRIVWHAFGAAMVEL